MFSIKNRSHRAFAVSTHLAVATTLTAAVALSTVVRADAPTGVRILSVKFAPRPVNKIDIGDFHFIPGQPAPVHTHAAPVFGYVSKGAIYYQVEGQKAQLLKTGDAFYEPVGPNILHFDNASATEEAVFTDFNLQQTGEPFIVFPTPPTAKIDRRTFPTVAMDGETVSRVDVYAQTLKPSATLAQASRPRTTLFYVAEGNISLQLPGGTTNYATGQTFSTPKETQATIVNTSDSSPARVIRFDLLNGK